MRGRRDGRVGKKSVYGPVLDHLMCGGGEGVGVVTKIM